MNFVCPHISTNSHELLLCEASFVLNWYSYLFFGEDSIYTCRYIKTWILIILKPGTQDKERKKQQQKTQYALDTTIHKQTQIM
jgi:hypothetical protein